MSDNDCESDDRCALDIQLDAAREHKDWRFRTIGMSYPAKMHAIIMKEYYRNVLEAVTELEGTFLTEDDYDDNFIAMKKQFLERRALKDAEEAPVKDSVLNVSTASAASASTVVDEDVVLEEILSEMQALNAQAADEFAEEIASGMEQGRAVIAERPGTPSEFTQAFNSAYDAEMKRLAESKRVTRSGTKMKKSGI